jgi:phage recombination protein Bet
MGETALMKAEAFPDDKIALIKRTVAAGTTNDELELFLYTAKRTGLDPLANQIHAVKRWNAAAGKQTMSIQVGIDGYRLIADRTGKYAPGPEPTFTYDDKGSLLTATAYVKKLVADTWHTVAATAHFDEYKGTKKGGALNHMWATKGHIMLGKCAEALALRRAFPAELSGVYTREEMDQANNQPETIPPAEPVPASRKKVNNGLWADFWRKAFDEADMSSADIWQAVWTVRPELETTRDIDKEMANRIVAELTEADFGKLFKGVEAMIEAKAREREIVDPDTGEVLPPREPGGDDREGE